MNDNPSVMQLILSAIMYQLFFEAFLTIVAVIAQYPHSAKPFGFCKKDHFISWKYV